MGSSPIRTILVFECAVFCKGELSVVYPKVVNCLIRLAVRTPRCGRGNPGSNPGLDIFLDLLGAFFEFSDSRNGRVELSVSPSSSVGRAPAF